MSKTRIPGLFIVGTDTEVGKTYITAAIARTLHRQGTRVVVYKPVLSGSRQENREADDDWILWQAAGRPGRLEDVCPQRFQAPVAPPLAAEAEGQTVNEALLVDAFHNLLATSPEIILVEGAGGLLSPISRNTSVADLAGRLNLPLIIVSANRLGVINHTLLTLTAAETKCATVPIAGIVLNDVPEGNMESDFSRSSNAAQLAERCAVPLLAHVAEGDPTQLEHVDWLRIAQPAVT